MQGMKAPHGKQMWTIQEEKGASEKQEWKKAQEVTEPQEK
jgi:hypothetical protein